MLIQKQDTGLGAAGNLFLILLLTSHMAGTNLLPPASDKSASLVRSPQFKSIRVTTVELAQFLHILNLMPFYVSISV